MSAENLALIRRFIGTWSERDLQGALDCVDPHVEIDWSGSMGPMQGTFSGRAGVRRFWHDMLDVWDRFELNVEESIDFGPDQLVTVVRVNAKGIGSGVEIEAHGAMIWTVRNGSIVKGVLFQTLDEALRAVTSTA